MTPALRETRTQLQTLEQKYAALQAEHDKVLADHAAARSLLDSIPADYKDLKGLTAVNLELQARLQATFKLLDQAQIEAQNQQRKYEHVNLACSAVCTERDEIQKDKVALRKRLDALLAAQPGNLPGLAQSKELTECQADNHDLQARLGASEALKEQLKKLNADKHQRLVEASDKNRELQATIATMQKAWEQVTAENKLLKETATTDQALRAQWAKADEMVKALKAAYDTLMKDNDAIKARCDQLTAIIKAKEAQAKVDSDLEQKYATLTKAKHELATKLAHTAEGLMTANGELKRANAYITGLAAEKAKQQEAYEKLTTDNKKLREAVDRGEQREHQLQDQITVWTKDRAELMKRGLYPAILPGGRAYQKSRLSLSGWPSDTVESVTFYASGPVVYTLQGVPDALWEHQLLSLSEALRCVQATAEDMTKA